MDVPARAPSNHLLDSMQATDFSRLEASMVQKRIEVGALIAEPGGVLDTVYFPLGAVFSVVTMMEDGQGCETGTIGYESATGLPNVLGDPISFNRTIVQVPGMAVSLPMAHLRAAAAASPALTSLVVAHIQVTSTLTEQSVACNSLHHIEARLCRWLLLSADRAGTEVLPLTQEFLGFMLGVQRTTVTLAARTLAASGAIRYRRGMLTIVDRDGVEEMACECYAVVKREQSRLLANHPTVR